MFGVFKIVDEQICDPGVEKEQKRATSRCWRKSAQREDILRKSQRASGIG
jgi:hypothetical protein